MVDPGRLTGARAVRTNVEGVYAMAQTTFFYVGEVLQPNIEPKFEAFECFFTIQVAVAGHGWPWPAMAGQDRPSEVFECFFHDSGRCEVSQIASR